MGDDHHVVGRRLTATAASPIGTPMSQAIVAKRSKHGSQTRRCALALVVASVATPALAGPTPRELLVQASFVDRDKAVAIARVDAAATAAEATLRAAPDDREAEMIRAMATCYRAKLAHSRADALAGRKLLERLLAKDPRHAEATLALGAWHVGAVYNVGPLMARAVLGARKQVGLDALDRSVALGGGRPFFTGVAGLLRLELDPADPRGRALVERAAQGQVAVPLDRVLQRAAVMMLASLRAGDPAKTQVLASDLLPFGRLPH